MLSDFGLSVTSSVLAVIIIFHVTSLQLLSKYGAAMRAESDLSDLSLITSGGEKQGPSLSLDEA